MKRKLHDRVFAIGGILMSVATVPALFGQISTPIWSAALITAVLGVFVVNYLTMKYYLAAATVTSQVVLWTAILIKAIH